MACEPTISVKRGASLTLQHRVKVNGAVVNLTDWEFAAQVNQGDLMVGEFIITPVDLVNGQIQMVLHTDETWPLGTLTWDVKYTMPDLYVHYSPTLKLSVTKRETP